MVKSLADALIDIGAFDEYAFDQQGRHAKNTARAIVALMPKSCVSASKRSSRE